MSREEVLLFNAFEAAVKIGDDVLVGYIRCKIRDHFRGRKGFICRSLNCLTFLKSHIIFFRRESNYGN